MEELCLCSNVVVCLSYCICDFEIVWSGRHYLSVSFALQVSGANMQPNAFAMPSILPIESVIVLGFSSSGSITEGEIVFCTHPDSPINTSNRIMIRYLSNSLFIRIIYTEQRYYNMVLFVIGICWRQWQPCQCSRHS